MTQQPMTESELKEFLTALRDNCRNKKKTEWYDGLIEDIGVAFTEHVPDAGKTLEESKEPDEELVPVDFNKFQDTDAPQLHLSANDADNVKDATQMVFHKMADGTLFCEIYPHKDKENIYTYDLFTFDKEAKNILIKFLNNKNSY